MAKIRPITDRSILRIAAAAAALFALCASVPGARAEEAKKPVLRIESVLWLARVEILRETAAFNALLDEPKKATGSRKKEVQALLAAGASRIANEYTLAKCVLDDADFANLIDPTLTLADDETQSKKTAVADLRDLYNKRFQAAIHGICERARDAFAKRMTSAEYRDSATGDLASTAISLDDRKRLVETIFIPTIKGKRSLLQLLKDRDIGFAILVSGASAAGIFGLILPGLIVSTVYAVDEAGNVVSDLRNRDVAISIAKLPRLTLSSPGLEVVLTDAERAVLREAGI